MVIAEQYTNGATQVTAQDAEIIRRLDCIRQLNVEAERIEDRINVEKDALKHLLKARGSNYEDDQGFARLVADGVRRSYDAEALDRLMLRSKWWDTRLRRYRREFNVRGGVRVK